MSNLYNAESGLEREFNLLELAHHYEISAGSVDVFMVTTRGHARNRRFLLGHWNTGELLIGLKEVATKNMQLLVSCTHTTELTRLNWDEITTPKRKEALRQWEEHFIAKLNEYKIPYPSESLINQSTPELQLRNDILTFFTNICPLLLKTIQLTQWQEQQQSIERKKNDTNLLQKAYRQMFSTLHIKQANTLNADKNNSLRFCIETAAQFYELPISEGVLITTLEEVSQNTGMQMRQVDLKNSWWKGVTQPILLQQNGEQHYCLALPRWNGGVTLYDPHNDIQKKLTAKEAEHISPVAWLLYRPLPQKKLKIKDLFLFAFKGFQSDFSRLFFVGIMAALLSLMTPLFTGVLFEHVVPTGNINQLVQIALALFIAACSASLFELVSTITILRIGSRLNQNLEIALWDRLIRLPANFFRKFSTGDLVQRAMATSSIRNLMAGVVINSLLSGVFSLSSLALLFYYDIYLAFTALALLIIVSIYTIIISVKQFSLYQSIVALTNQLSGLIIQLLAGIGKIQSSGREKTAFYLWGIKNSQIIKERFKANRYSTLLSSINALALPIISVVIFAQFLNRDNPFGLGVFLAFNAALGQFTAGMLGFADAMSTVINSIPMMKCVAPIIEQLPEVHVGKYDPGVLTGKVEVESLKFSFSSKEKQIIEDVSFVIEPGQFVAIAGPSGSGKSTLIRLLLGFETPSHGTILYDDHDIKQLNIQRVREQFGVVLQNSVVMPGTLFDNIVGFSALTMDDAWYAAEMAGLADDIRKMPMGMHTIISERGGTLSGGQRQRVLIARALAKKPKILFFDEATSALDNVTQAIVIKSLETLQITRLVIAHRLSTLEKADSIIVMHDGKIIEQGNYKHLMAQKGLFQSMAKRQLLD